MGTSNAQRQAAYRERLKDEGDWIRTAVSLPTKKALERLSRHYGVTQKAALERVLEEAQRRELMEMDSAAQEHFYRD